MADVDLTANEITVSGFVPGAAPAGYLGSTTTPALSLSDQMVVPNDGKTFLHVKNGHASDDITVTIETPIEIDGLALADLVVVVGEATERFIGPFPRGVYGDPFKFTLGITGGAAIGDITVGVLRI